MYESIKTLKIIKNLREENIESKQIELYLKDNYEFKLDEISNRTLFRKKNENNGLRQLKEYDFNSIYRELINYKLSISKSDLNTLLNSDFVEKYNPVLAYINGLEKWDGKTDYIDQLAQTVITTDDDYFRWAFKKWFIAYILCATKNDVTNHTSIIFTGRQGIGKTTWLLNLVPEELKNYKFSGKINPSSKDSTLLLAERILINMDELATFSKNQIEAFKELITKDVISERKAYGRETEDYVRRASFVGSANHDQILSDVTGNRRFIINEVISIDYEHSIDLKKVYSQAKALAETDFKFYFDIDDISRVEKNNKKFKSITSEEEYIDMYFEIPTIQNESEVVYMSATEVIDFINANKTTYLSLKANIIGKILKSKGFSSTKKGNSKKYGIIIK